MKNKKAFEMSFAWIFALIVGGLILFFAIFGVVKLIKTERVESEFETAKQLTVLLEPLETTLKEGKVTHISFRLETKIFMDCSSIGNFGNQKIKTSTKSSVGKEYEIPEDSIRINNKYIFSQKLLQGKKIYLFILPFEMPFKVSDVIIAYSDNYCFISPPDEIKDELESISQQIKGSTNFDIVTRLSQCEEKAKKVCFSNTGNCDIFVSGTCFSPDCESNFDSGFVSKQGKTLNYVTKSLMYGAIFSDPDLYECNVKRLMLRLAKIAQLYRDESMFITRVGCRTGLEPELVTLADIALNLQSSQELNSLDIIAKKIKNKNQALDCKLYI